MSNRIEWTVAEYAKPKLRKRGDELNDGNKVTHEAALDFGALVVEGTTDQLIELCGHALQQLVPR